MKNILILLLTVIIIESAPVADRMVTIPGYPKQYNTSIYSGYLSLQSTQRQAHYVFVESIKGSFNKDPITLWLNGGPGCSSLLGFLQEIGPYYLEDGKDYHQGDNLTLNQHSWHKLSNLLFLESPAGVGYSYNLEKNYTYTDSQTALDNLNSVIDFFMKFPEYRNNQFWIAGESYAGKYIPDLAVLIDKYNRGSSAQKIHLKGILVGNGIMSFEHLQESTMEYLIDRSFVDPELSQIYKESCYHDKLSAGCRFAEIRIREDTDELNPYNVYGYCYYNDSFEANSTKRRFLSQETILIKLKKKYSASGSSEPKANGAPCAYFDGIYDYFNLNDELYHAKFAGQIWNGPCADIKYQIDPAGSMQSYSYLLGLLALSETRYKIILYSGTWDAVVPYVDTIKNIKKLNLIESYKFVPWFTDDQHSGFQQLYSGILFVTFKGASHQVPQTRRAQAFHLLYDTFEGNKDNDSEGNKYNDITDSEGNKDNGITDSSKRNFDILLQ